MNSPTDPLKVVRQYLQAHGYGNAEWSRHMRKEWLAALDALDQLEQERRIRSDATKHLKSLIGTKYFPKPTREQAEELWRKHATDNLIIDRGGIWKTRDVLLKDGFLRALNIEPEGDE